MSEIQFVKDTFSEYLGKKDFISASDIKNFMKSPRYYFFKKYEDVKPLENEEERHFVLGTALHELLLEPHTFKDHFIQFEKCDRRTIEGKKKYAEFQLKAAGKTILFDDEMEMLQAMAENGLKNPTLIELIKNSYRELSCYTTDESTGLKIKLRPDVLSKNKSTITDIKTTVDSSIRGFRKDVYNYGYSITHAFYADFLKKENYVFAAIEKQKPYQIGLYVLPDEMVEYGRKQYRTGLDLMKFCYDKQHFPSHNQFEIMKECYELGNLDEYFETCERSANAHITILNG